MARHLRHVVAILCAVALVAGCGGGSGAPDAAGEGATRTVSTIKGDVRIPVAPKRVVLLNYGLAGYLYDLGLPVVAMVTEYTDRDPAKTEPYPAWAADFAKNGATFLHWPAAGFNVEAISAQKPDLIVGGGLGFPFKQAGDAYDKLTAIAPTVIVDNKLENWQGQFEYLAEAFDKPQVYRDAVKKYDARAEQVRANITPPPGPVSYVSMTAQGKAYALIQGRGVPLDFERVGIRAAPVFDPARFTPYTAGGDSFEVSPELLGATLNQASMFVIGFHTTTQPVAKLKENPVWAALPAFQSGRAYDLPYWVQRPDFDHALATLDTLEKLFPTK